MKLRTFLFCVLIFASQSVFADKVVRVLGIQEALLSSQAAGDFRAQLEREFSADESTLNNLERQAVAARDRLEQNRGLASEEEFQQLGMQFEKAYVEYQTLAEELSQRRMQREEEFLAQMRPKLDQAIKTLIESENIEVIVAKQATVYSSDSVDITPRVIELLNQL